MSRNKLYAFSLLTCTAGYTWLGLSLHSTHEHAATFRLCLIKVITGVPCPSCGITRSILTLLRGDIQGALYLNPLGFPMLLFLIVTPVWIVQDLLFRKQSYLQLYIKAECLFSRKPVAIGAILLILTNWIWNISKGL